MDIDVAPRNKREILWTVEEAAHYLDLAIGTVYTKARDGEIPSLKIGRAVRFRPADVEAWAAAQARQPAEAVTTDPAA